MRCPLPTALRQFAGDYGVGRNTVIQTENLTHSYSVGTPFERAGIAGVDLAVYEGEFLGIIGHTGSGKSTLIQHLNGLLKPTSGKVVFDGIDIHSSKEYTRAVRFQVGLVFQYPEYQLFAETVQQDIAFGPRNMGLAESEIDERVRQSADFVGLDSALLSKSPFDLSGGEKRRAAIAGVLAMRPRVLILDEPTAGLDPVGRAALLDNIETFRRETGATVLFVTHSMGEIARRVSRIVVLDHGKVAMVGTPCDIFAQSERLEKMGLAIPEITQIVQALRRQGIKLPADIFTVDAAAKALQKLL